MRRLFKTTVVCRCMIRLKLPKTKHRMRVTLNTNPVDEISRHDTKIIMGDFKGRLDRIKLVERRSWVENLITKKDY